MPIRKVIRRPSAAALAAMAARSRELQQEQQQYKAAAKPVIPLRLQKGYYRRGNDFPLDHPSQFVPPQLHPLKTGTPGKLYHRSDRVTPIVDAGDDMKAFYHSLAQ